ncbi:MAG: YqiA/YcfP family alpha/beta fold hydrolase [Bacteroidota bacterium]
MKREYLKWFSPVLNKEIELLVFGHGGQPVIFFPTRTARFYDYENWGVIGALGDKISNGHLQVFCVDSNDIESFYSNTHPSEKIKRHLDYEQYILQEVIPLVREYNSNPLTVAGCSLGGYHAVNIAFRHPQHFKKVVGMSARYDLTLSGCKFPDLLNGYFDENIYFNMPSMFVPNITDEETLKLLRQMEMVIVIGREDPFLQNNEHLANSLGEKELAHDFHVWNGEAHRCKYWRQMVHLYL